MTVIEQFKGREAGPVIQFIKYGISGGVATAVHISLFYVLAINVFPALTANDIVTRLLHCPATVLPDAIRARNSMMDNAIAFVFSNLTAYLLNIFWVFKRGRHHFLIEIGMFYVVSGLSLFLGTSLMGILIAYWKVSTTLAFGSNLVTALLINYAMRKYVIFKG